MLSIEEIDRRFEENRKLLGNFPLPINLNRFREVFDQAKMCARSERVHPIDIKYERGFYIGICECGGKVVTNQAFCSHCGIELDWVLTAEDCERIERANNNLE